MNSERQLSLEEKITVKAPVRFRPPLPPHQAPFQIGDFQHNNLIRGIKFKIMAVPVGYPGRYV